MAWSDETMTVASVNSKSPVEYVTLKDKHQVPIEGTYYPSDLLKVGKVENTDE